MIKKSDYQKEMEKLDTQYKFIKLYRYIRAHLTLNKEKRKTEINMYEYLFDNDFSLDRKDNSLSEDFFYKPTNIIISELLLKEELPKVKMGLHRLIRKHASHKFLVSTLFGEDIDDLIDRLDHSITSGESFNRLGMFDFANMNKLDRYIYCFDLTFRNFSSSYVLVEMNITLSNQFQSKMAEFIKNDYKISMKQVIRTWGNNRKKSGYKVSYAVGGGPMSESVKSRLLYEQMQNVKLDFLHYMKNYFPFVFYRKAYAVLGINVFETNIDFRQENPYQFLKSVGVDFLNGFLLSEEQKIFDSTDRLPNDEQYDSDMMMLYNPNKVKDYRGYQNARNHVLENFFYTLDELYKIIVLKNVASYYFNCCVKYRNLINGTKMHRSAYKKLLKLKYSFEKDFYLYKKVMQEISIEKEAKKVTKFLEDNYLSRRSCYHGYYPYKYFAYSPKNMLEQIEKNILKLSQDINDKLALSYNLKSYREEQRGNYINYAQLVFAVATFGLLIFPDKVDVIANFFKSIWGYIKRFIS